MHPHSMHVHRAESGDEATWVKAINALVPEVERDNQIVSLADLARTLCDSRCYLFLALRDTKPVGLLSAYRFPDVQSGGYLVYLYDIIVDGSHRRRGVGVALILALIEACRADGVRQIWAGTALDNLPARRTFETTGAALEGETYAEYTWTLDTL